jgi:hypothetical protein
MGTLLARVPRQEFRVSRCARTEPVRVLQLRIKQNLLFDLQGIVSIPSRQREIPVGVAGLNPGDTHNYAKSVTIIELN